MKKSTSVILEIFLCAVAGAVFGLMLGYAF
jgi:hypothetical protein